MRNHHLGDSLAHLRLHLSDRVILSLRDQLSIPRRKTQQFAERLECRQVPVLGLFDMFEPHQIVHRGGSQFLY